MDSFHLLSTLIIFVYGEFAQTRIFASRPPVHRRLAAIAQAALIARCVSETGGDANGFVEWAYAARLGPFMLQCLVDLREEPRWTAELVLGDQLRNELYGRVLSAAYVNEGAVRKAQLQDLLLDDGVEDGLRNALDIGRAFMAGPLEGAVEPAIHLPESHLDSMREEFRTPHVRGDAFLHLINASMLFLIPRDLADLAADAIARADYRIDLPDGIKETKSFFMALAGVAAITRCHKLADALYIILRNFRHLYPDELDVDGVLRIGLMAAASREGMSEWSTCVGQCMNDLAFGNITREEALPLHEHLVTICRLAPELWVTCGEAEAALKSVLGI